MASSPFERQVIDDDTSSDRNLATPQMSSGPQQFPPTPSFVDRDRPSVRLVELPAWLQAFASSVGEPTEDETPEQQPAEEPMTTSSNDQQTQPAPQPKPAPQQTSVAGTDFISEDDLPEWLRAIAPEGPAESSFDALVQDTGIDGDQIAVPTITRAWSTSKDSRGVDEATSLFALVASQAPQTAIPDQPGSAPAAPAPPRQAPAETEVAGYGSEHPPVLPAVSADLPVAVPDKTEEGAKTASSLPILPIAAAAIILLVLLGVAAVMFLI